MPSPMSAGTIRQMTFGFLLLLGACSAQPQAQTTHTIPLYGPAGVSAQAVRQGMLGTCYFHATIAAIANNSPQLLRGAIKENSDSTYTVQFRDGSVETVLKDDVLYGRTKFYDQSDGLWVLVLLRGMAQRTVRNALIDEISAAPLPIGVQQMATQLVQSNDLVLAAYDRAIRTTISQGGDMERGALKAAVSSEASTLSIPGFLSQPVIDMLDSQGFFDGLAQRIKLNAELFGAYHAMGAGGLPERVMAAFDGQGSYVAITDASSLRATLTKAQAQSLPAVASTKDSLDTAVLGRIHAAGGPVGWWIPAHAYTVLEYSEAQDTVTLRNPWGNFPGPDGVFTLSISDFMATYQGMSLMN